MTNCGVRPTSSPTTPTPTTSAPSKLPTNAPTKFCAFNNGYTVEGNGAYISGDPHFV